VVFGDSTDSGLCGFSIGFGPGIAWLGEAFSGLRGFAKLGELLVPLTL
jgi:hypothetical protein